MPETIFPPVDDWEVRESNDPNNVELESEVRGDTLWLREDEWTSPAQNRRGEIWAQTVSTVDLTGVDQIELAFNIFVDWEEGQVELTVQDESRTDVRSERASGEPGENDYENGTDMDDTIVMDVLDLDGEHHLRVDPVRERGGATVELTIKSVALIDDKYEAVPGEELVASSSAKGAEFTVQLASIDPVSPGRYEATLRADRSNNNAIMGVDITVVRNGEVGERTSLDRGWTRANDQLTESTIQFDAEPGEWIELVFRPTEAWENSLDNFGMSVSKQIPEGGLSLSCSMDADEVLRGDGVTVSANVTNEGGAPPETTIEFYIGESMVDSVDVTIPANESEVVTERLVFSRTGTFPVEIRAVSNTE